MEFRLLGPVEMIVDGRPIPIRRRQERHALAILLLQAGQPVSIDRIAELIWAQDPPLSARDVVQTYLSRLRQALKAADGVRLERRGHSYRLAVDPETVDVHRFERLLDRARTVSEAAPRAELLRAALALWRGPALADVGADAIRERLAARLDEARRWALDQRIVADLALGRHEDLLGELTELVSQFPLDERLTGHLMVALYRSGRRNDAIARYWALHDQMRDELGLDPGDQLRDLHTAILRGDQGLDPPSPTVASGESIPVTAGVVKPAQLPVNVRGFVGRDVELARLDTIATDAEPAAVVISAVSGTAGVGKTALAVHWAHRVTERFPDGQLYLNLHGFDRDGRVVTPVDAVRALLDSLGVPAERIPIDLDAQTALYRTLLAGQRMLILLDNASDAEQVRPLLPGAPGCLVLVTSRDQLTSLIAADGAHLVALDVLSQAEAVDLLARRLGRARTDAEPAAVTDIVDACARLPLALCIAAARAAIRPGFALRTLAAELRQMRGGLDAFAGGDTGSDVRVVFSWSYRVLSPAAARVFRLLALHPGPDITVPAAASLTALPPGTVALLMAELARAHLVVEHLPGRYARHDLLRAYATELVQLHDSQPQREAAVHRLVDHYLQTARAADARLDPHRDPVDPPPSPDGVIPEPITDDVRALEWFNAEHGTLLGAVAQAAAARLHQHTAHLAWALMTFLDRSGYWHDLANVQRLALDAVEQLGDPAAKAHVHRSLARAYARMGRYDEALSHLRRALAFSIDIGDHTGQARTHLNLAWVLELKETYGEALEHANQALSLNRAIGHRAAQANALNAVGWLEVRLGADERAVASCQQALRLFEELDDSHGQATTWDSLGFAHHRLGQFDQAMAAYQRAVDLLRKAGDRYYEATALRHLGEVHTDSGNTAAAQDAWRQAVSILDELNHPDAEDLRSKLLPDKSAIRSRASSASGSSRR